ncbi:MAG: hypothetical protein QNL62_03995 [Gammaproteobacteria bacterium]|nr:hypothetical protein [Gammaproteobacteria bacterium]
MPDDIQPLTSVSSSPLVRERRHYPGDQQKQQSKKQDKKASDDAQTRPEVDNSIAQNDMDIDKKNARDNHIDEFA